MEDKNVPESKIIKRRRKVTDLMSKGYNDTQIASMLKVTRQTIHHDKIAIKKAEAIYHAKNIKYLKNLDSVKADLYEKCENLRALTYSHIDGDEKSRRIIEGFIDKYAGKRIEYTEDEMKSDSKKRKQHDDRAGQRYVLRKKLYEIGVINTKDRQVARDQLRKLVEAENKILNDTRPNNYQIVYQQNTNLNFQFEKMLRVTEYIIKTFIPKEKMKEATEVFEKMYSEAIETGAIEKKDGTQQS